MEKIISVVQFCIANYQLVITSVVGILTGVIGIAMIVPGEQPEKALQGVVDVLAKLSKK